MKLEEAEAIANILECEGYDDEHSFLEDYAFQSVVPGCCMNPDCGWVKTSCEPDLTKGWCEGCDKQTVSSAMILMGLI